MGRSGGWGGLAGGEATASVQSSECALLRLWAAQTAGPGNRGGRPWPALQGYAPQAEHLAKGSRAEHCTSYVWMCFAQKPSRPALRTMSRLQAHSPYLLRVPES